jgi:hypothetical protein
MPSSSLKALAKRAGMKLADAEKKWNKAKQIVSKEYDYTYNDPEYWALVTTITSRMIGFGEQKTSFGQYMILQEILGLQPYPFKIEVDGATFTDSASNKIGVVFEDNELTLPDRTLSVVNVSFGILKTHQKNIAVNLDTSLTNAGDARKIFSTVGAIVEANNLLKNADIVVLAGADAFKERRAKIYMIAFLEIRDKKLQRFYKAEQIRTSNGTIALVAQSVELTDEERKFIADNLQLSK